jgi:hypothetical protein
VWRGPIVNSAIDKFLLGTAWGPLDVLLVDMPPGEAHSKGARGVEGLGGLRMMLAWGYQQQGAASLLLMQTSEAAELAPGGPATVHGASVVVCHAMASAHSVAGKRQAWLLRLQVGVRTSSHHAAGATIALKCLTLYGLHHTLVGGGAVAAVQVLAMPR